MATLPSRLSGVAIFLAAGWLAIAFGMAPAAGPLSAGPAPDLLFCVVALWVARRPASAPAAAVFALGLARDLLGGGPPGAGALTLLLAAEALRRHAPTLRRGGALLEWAAVCGGLAAALAGQWLLLSLSFAQPPAAMDLLGRLAASAAVWPLMALALRAPGASAQGARP